MLMKRKRAYQITTHLETQAANADTKKTCGKSALTHQRVATAVSTDTECMEISAEPSLCSSQKLSTST